LNATASERLRAKLDLAQPALQQEALQLWAVPEPRETYPLYLEQMHMVVRSGVSLMNTAMRQAGDLPASCGFKALLIDYLARHIEEEKGHDMWLLEDYAAAGGDPEVLLEKIPSLQVANMAGAQYYWILHHHPVMVMGHLAALETYHPPVGFAKHLCNLTGLPRHAFRAIARHEKLDPFHERDIYALIDALELSAREETAVGISGLHTMQSGLAVLASIREKAEKGKPLPA
jgi:hypothetical protein